MNLIARLLATFVLFSISLSAYASTNGAWTASLGGNNALFHLQERSSGAIVGYLAGQKGTLITSGSNSASTVVLNISHTDPGSTSSGTFTGTLSGSTISGNYVDSSGSTAVTLTKTSTAYKEETWVFTESTSSLTLDVGRVSDPSGPFHSGSYVAASSCSFVGCGGVITSWSVSGSNHTIVATAGGSCTNTTTFTGTFDTTTKLLSGTYATVDCTSSPVTSGSFSAKKAGFTGPVHSEYFLRQLADFGDNVEAESTSSTGSRFIDLYMNNGLTKQSIVDSISSIFTDYNSLSFSVGGVSEIITINDSEVHSTLLNGPRMKWLFTLTGTPAAGGSVVTITDQSVNAANSDLHWLSIISTAAYFSGNGHFDMTTPYTNVSDVDAIPNGFSNVTSCPWGAVHNGIDIMPVVTSTLTIRAPAGGVVYMDPVFTWNNTNGWQSNVRINHTPSFYTEYAFETFSTNSTHGTNQSLWIVVSNGTKVEAGDTIGSLYAVGASAHVHFGLYQNSTAVCPGIKLQGSAFAEILGILRATWSGANMCYN